MTLIREAATVDAPIDEVWAVVADPRNLPRWNRYIRSVRGVPPEGLGPGSRYWTHMGGFGVTFRISAEVLEFDPPHYSMIRLSGPLHATVRTWLRSEGSRTHLEHEVDYHVRVGAVGTLLERVLRRFGASAMLRRGVRAQKEQIERG